MKTGRARATWVSRREIDFFCVDFSGFKSDPAGLAAEIEVSDTVIRRQTPDTLLLAIDLNQAQLTPDLVVYLRTLFSRVPSPLRKVAIIGLSSWQRWWGRLVGRITWPENSAFFTDWETAKSWLIGEIRSGAAIQR